MENSFQNLHFFFKRSSARLKKDYALLSTITGVTAEYVKKHVEIFGSALFRIMRKFEGVPS